MLGAKCRRQAQVFNRGINAIRDASLLKFFDLVLCIYTSLCLGLKLLLSFACRTGQFLGFGLLAGLESLVFSHNTLEAINQLLQYFWRCIFRILVTERFKQGALAC